MERQWTEKTRPEWPVNVLPTAYVMDRPSLSRTDWDGLALKEENVQEGRSRSRVFYVLPFHQRQNSVQKGHKGSAIALT